LGGAMCKVTQRRNLRCSRPISRWSSSARQTHSITSSARARTVEGTSRPSAFAVLRLSTVLFDWHLHGKVGGLLSLKNAINVSGSASVLINVIRPIANQAASGCVVACGVHRRQLVPRRESNDQMAISPSGAAPSVTMKPPLEECAKAVTALSIDRDRVC
jgi:hypothetical protein